MKHERLFLAAALVLTAAIGTFGATGVSGARKTENMALECFDRYFRHGHDSPGL